MEDTNGKVPADQQPDTTQGTGVDDKITVVDRREESPLPRININEPVTPGHDMVVNHIDGSQELAQGHVAAAVHAQEAKDPSKVVAAADVEAGPADENPRTPDPETNGPDQQVSGKTADVVVADSQPDVNPNEVTPAHPTPESDGDAQEEAGKAPAKAEAPSSTDVEGA